MLASNECIRESLKMSSLRPGETIMTQHELLQTIGQKLPLHKLEMLRGRFMQSVKVPPRPSTPAFGLRRVLHQAQTRPAVNFLHRSHQRHIEQEHNMRVMKSDTGLGKQSVCGQLQQTECCSTMYATVFVALGYADPIGAVGTNCSAKDVKTQQIYIALTQDQFVQALQDVMEPTPTDHTSCSELAPGQSVCSQLDLARAFRVLDTDGSGKVSWDTFTNEVFLSRCTSTGKDAPGVNSGAADESEDDVANSVTSSLFQLCTHGALSVTSGTPEMHARCVTTIALSCASTVDMFGCAAGNKRCSLGEFGNTNISTPLVGPVSCSNALVVQAESNGPPLAWAWDRTVHHNVAHTVKQVGKIDRDDTVIAVSKGGHASVVTDVAIMLRSRRVAVATIGAGVEFYDFELHWKSPVVPDIQSHGKYLWSRRYALSTKSRVAATNAVGSTQHNPVLKRHSPLVLHYQPLEAPPWTQRKQGSSGHSNSKQAWEEMLLVGDDGGNVHVYTFCAVYHKEIACGSRRDDGNTNRIWSFNDPRTFRLCVLRNHSDRVTALALIGENEGGWVVSASLDGTVKVFDLARNRLRCTFNYHQNALHPLGPPRIRTPGGVYAAVWCKEAKLIASCGRDKGVLLWSPFARSKPMKLTGCGTVTQLSYIQGCALGPPQSHPHLYGLLCTLGFDARVLIYDICHTRVLQTIEPVQMMRCPKKRCHGGDAGRDKDGELDNIADRVQPVGCANRVAPTSAADVSAIAWDNARRRLILATREGLRVWKWVQTKDNIGGSRHREGEPHHQSSQTYGDIQAEATSRNCNTSKRATLRIPSTARQRNVDNSSKDTRESDTAVQDSDLPSPEQLVVRNNRWKSGQHVLLWLDRETDAPLLYARQTVLEAEGKGAEFAALVKGRVSRMRTVPAIVVGTDRHKLNGDEQWIRVRYTQWAKSRFGEGVQHIKTVRSVPSGALSVGGISQTARLRELDRHFRAPLPIKLDSRFVQNNSPKVARNAWPYSNMRKNFQRQCDMRTAQVLDASPGSIGEDLARIEHLEHVLAMDMAELAAKRTGGPQPPRKFHVDQKHAPRPPGTRLRSRAPRHASQRHIRAAVQVL